MIYLFAPDRRHLQTLIEVRELLDKGQDKVGVMFADGSAAVEYSQSDLPALRQKIIFSM